MIANELLGSAQRRRLWNVALIVVLGMWASGVSLSAQEACFAYCADGLAPVEDLGPIAGTQAPEVTLRVLDTDPRVDGPISLEELVREKPVVLAFGSYT